MKRGTFLYLRRRIIETRFGLRDGRPHTLEMIARRFGLAKERIRQIEREALHKLRTSDQTTCALPVFPSDYCRTSLARTDSGMSATSS